MIIKNLKHFLLDTLFPKFCLGCSKQNTILCDDCFGTIEIAVYQFCPFCSQEKRVINKGKCAKHQPCWLNGLFSAASYQNILVRKTLHCFKYSPYLKTLAKPLSELIVAHFLLSGNKILFHSKENGLFTAVPLSPSKARKRGYNQSELLAKELSGFFGIAFGANILLKTKKTLPQVGLTREKRKENVQNAFSVKNSEAIQGKIIFLVDDVFTTGATLEECAKVLKQAGAKQVWGITVARETFQN